MGCFVLIALCFPWQSKVVFFRHAREKGRNPLSFGSRPARGRERMIYRFSCTSQSATSPSSTSSQPLNMAAMWLVRVWPVVVM